MKFKNFCRLLWNLCTLNINRVDNRSKKEFTDPVVLQKATDVLKLFVGFNFNEIDEVIEYITHFIIAAKEKPHFDWTEKELEEGLEDHLAELKYRQEMITSI